MDMSVQAAGGANQPLARNDLRSGANDQPWIDPGLNERIARLADPDDSAIADADIALDDAPVVENHRVGDDEVKVRRAHRLLVRRLAHAVADHLAAAEHDF